MVKKSEAEKLADMIAMVQGDSLFKEEDVADIVVEAEETGDYKALYRAYMRRGRKAAEEAANARLSGMTEAEVAAEKERLRREVLDKARRRRAQGKLEIARRLEAAAPILDFEGIDLDDESP